MQIEILDAIECQLLKVDAIKLKPCLSYDAVYYKQGLYKKTRHQYEKQVFTFKGKKYYRFHTGLLPRVTRWCADHNIPLQIVGEEIKIPRQNKPFLKGIEFREDQLRLINAACKNQRGIIVSATGSGKTLMQLGFISCYPKNNFLILAHTTAIVQQTYNELKKFGFKSIEMIGGDIKAHKPNKQITVSTMQSFIKIDPQNYIDYYDGVLLDECHHLQSEKSTYSTIFKNLLAPIRLGFTATTRTTDEAILVNEGLLGPVIETTTIQEAAELGILAKPKLKLIKAKYNPSITDLRKYADVYTYGIVKNEQRTKQIAEIVQDFYGQNKTGLIFVTQIEHGKLIIAEIKNLFQYKAPFIQGEMPYEIREEIKTKLIKNKIKICVATTSWREGVDIPNLDYVILSGGGKSEIQTLQGIGRGLRKTKDKDSVIIVDFLDLSHNYLIRQTGERLAVYSDNNWL